MSQIPLISEKQMMLTVLIPAYNEARNLKTTITEVIKTLHNNAVEHEILVVNDNSTDTTLLELNNLCRQFSTLRYVNNNVPHGFGRAIKKGLDEYKGDAVAIYMADASDSPDDLVMFYKKIQEGYDCVFGSRFMKGGRVKGYPVFKYVLNRIGNYLIKKVFKLEYDDITNAFKCYRRKVIEDAKPFLSNHFNITVELPVKAVIYGFSYVVVPNSWTNRKFGVSKLKIRQMFSQYLAIILFLLLKKKLDNY
jgi:dolichol-phosphate mannosyltransferase